MAHDREVSVQPVVVLEVDKLFGMRQIAQMSTAAAEGGDRRAMASPAQAGRLLTKIGAPET